MDDLKDKRDEELIVEILENPNYFEIIIFRYKDKLFHYIRRISGLKNEDIEDLLQDIFISAYQNLNSFRKELSFSAWIYRIAHNKTINFWKKHEKNLNSLNIDEHLFLIDSVFSDSLVEIEQEKIENGELVSKILNNMDQKYKEVLILKFLEGQSYEEISDILKKPQGTIATLISRAKKQFNQELEILRQKYE